MQNFTHFETFGGVNWVDEDVAVNVDAVLGRHDRVFILAGRVHQENVVFRAVNVDAFVESWNRGEN